MSVWIVHQASGPPKGDLRLRLELHEDSPRGKLVDGEVELFLQQGRGNDTRTDSLAVVKTTNGVWEETLGNLVWYFKRGFNTLVMEISGQASPAFRTLFGTTNTPAPQPALKQQQKRKPAPASPKQASYSLEISGFEILESASVKPEDKGKAYDVVVWGVARKDKDIEPNHNIIAYRGPHIETVCQTSQCPKTDANGRFTYTFQAVPAKKDPYKLHLELVLANTNASKPLDLEIPALPEKKTETKAEAEQIEVFPPIGCNVDGWFQTTVKTKKAGKDAAMDFYIVANYPVYATTVTGDPLDPRNMKTGPSGALMFYLSFDPVQINVSFVTANGTARTQLFCKSSTARRRR